MSGGGRGVSTTSRKEKNHAPRHYKEREGYDSVRARTAEKDSRSKPGTRGERTCGTRGRKEGVATKKRAEGKLGSSREKKAELRRRGISLQRRMEEKKIEESH